MLNLSSGPLVARDNWDFSDAELLRCFLPEMSVDYFAIAPGEHWDLEPEQAPAFRLATSQCAPTFSLSSISIAML